MKGGLTWQDMKDIIAAEGSIYDEFDHDPEKIFEAYPTEEAFYTEVLKRYNKTKEGKCQRINDM